MKISVVGTGYVGLVTGACLAEMGNNVVCLDLDAAKIEKLKNGEIPIYEPGLEAIVQRNLKAGRLRFTTDIDESVAYSTVQFIAVGTPPDEDGSADLKYVLAAARNIAERMTDYKVVIDKSTVPVGTARKVDEEIARTLAARGADLSYSVISNPEFLKEGAAVEDFMRPDRIIIGADDEPSRSLMRDLYAPFVRNHDRLIMMDVASAELTKYAANAMLATRISFMNDLALFAEKVGADIESVRVGIGSDARIGFSFLYSGCGYGGSCFPKDVKALIHSGHEVGHKLRILEAVEQVNDDQKRLLGRRAIAKFGEDLSGKHFALWGLAFKPNTDDMREAPSRELIEELLARGATVRAYDPIAMEEAHRLFGKRISYADSALQACQDADALFIVTEWKEFRSPDFDALSRQMKAKVIFDGRNLYPPSDMADMGWEYLSIGRPRHTVH
ncbi:UDP-glucose/GDP-mannose dehydrogenase family protein [Orrella sp. JC864]|uniref:UDP-glucose dehydrogenase family protein n=1 Tax=Orrella sp. JC864 TaxID=3120298 RepID=UPI00300BDB5D